MDLRIVLLAAAVMLAGCSGSDSKPAAEPLTQEAAEAQAEAAIEDLAKDLSAPGETDLIGMAGTMDFDDEMGEGEMTMDLEWGAEGTSHAAILVRTTGGFDFSLEIEIWCALDKQVMLFDGVYYESRPADDCSGFLDEGQDLGLETLDESALEGLRQMAVTPESDGSVTATYLDENGEEITFVVDPQGRITKFELTAEGGAGVFTMKYGNPDLIQAPAAAERLPASVTASCYFFDSNMCTADIWDGDDAPNADFEVRIHAQNDDGNGALLATFPMTPGSATSNGYTFTFVDDGDGMFGDGDSFSVEGEPANVVVFDLWAQKDITETIPGLEIVALIAGLALVAWRRR